MAWNRTNYYDNLKQIEYHCHYYILLFNRCNNYDSRQPSFVLVNMENGIRQLDKQCLLAACFWWWNRLHWLCNVADLFACLDQWTKWLLSLPRLPQLICPLSVHISSSTRYPVPPSKFQTTAGSFHLPAVYLAVN